MAAPNPLFFTLIQDARTSCSKRGLSNPFLPSLDRSKKIRQRRGAESPRCGQKRRPSYTWCGQRNDRHGYKKKGKKIHPSRLALRFFGAELN